MTNKYFSGKKGHYIFCDICGQACYDWEVVRLSTFSGRPGLLVCPADADKADPGLIPYTLPPERSVDLARINHTDTTNAAAVINHDTTNVMTL